MPAEHGFTRLRVTSSSAQEEEGMERLWVELKSAARYQLEQYGKVRLPANWVAIGDELRTRVGEKTMPRAEFDEVCRAKHGSAVPGVVLEYLHRGGQVFYRKDAFQNQVVLDLAWALTGVYAVLDRERALPFIRSQAGRFSAQLLAALLWQDYTSTEKELFLSLMKQCQICFQVAEDLYIAPGLLPEEAKVSPAMEQVWRSAKADAIAHLQYEFLHEGVLRAMLCGLGTKAGVNAVYWAYGICFYDAKMQSTARIRTELPDIAAHETGGRIVVEAAGPQAPALARGLVSSIERLNIGKAPVVSWLAGGVERTEAERADANERKEPFAEITPAPVPQAAGERQPVYVSYAWGGESEALVDEFERKLPGGLRLVRDKNAMRPGDWISSFMAEIGRAEFVLVMVSEKSIRSIYCMQELLHLFHTSSGERAAMMRKLVPLRVGGVRFSTAEERDEHVRYWQEKRAGLEAKFANRPLLSVGERDRAELLAILDFEHRTSDILAWVADTLMPQGAEVRTKGVEAAIGVMVERMRKGG